MVQRSANYEQKVVRKSLTLYQIFGIGDDSLMAYHYAFGLSRSSCGVENICSSVWNFAGGKNLRNLPEPVFRNVALKRCGYASGLMNGKVSYKEIN